MNFSWKLPSHNQPTPHAYTIPTHDTPPPPPTNIELNDPILYNRVYRVHICTTHHYALRNLARHLLNKHTLSLRQRREIIATYADDDCVSPEQIESPIELVDPIKGLAAPVTVYQCQASTCRVIQSNHDNIRKHANQEHGWRKSQDQPTYWNIVQAQTFFTSRNLIKYFVV
ncbi:hypothetical protein PV08_12094 [Exophiala spinifera]|uniref:Uncharacterized protein n=1 Tax=Exophiala spinifera TaxID=91928 RepID=A0A0D1Y3Y8_9EURO|nr:uncharacterized protein PV08_12094 [Exophiala spinifera]KIW09656.1 hypothetical protein PV08_12094 [Exophiala spinifera]